MAYSDKTEIFAAPPVIVKIERGDGKLSKNRFAHSFQIGRGEECDIRFEDRRVSSVHAEVLWEDGQWWLNDPGSKNGTYLNDSRVTRATLPPEARIELAPGGPVLHLEIEQPKPRTPAAGTPFPGDVHDISARYFGNDNTVPAGERTMLIRKAFHTVRKKQRSRYRLVIGIVLLVLAAALGALYYQTQRVKKLEELHASAENVFYTAKALELQLSKLQEKADLRSDPKVLGMQRELQQMETIYDEFLDELGLSKGNLTEEEWLIYKVARTFGECTVTMPKGFVETVKKYIQYWRQTPLYASAIVRAKSNGYPKRVREILLANGMPPQFFYLALQESKFDKNVCGPETYAGIAKGIWQFIPSTAYQYHLRTGPLVDVRRADPLDERQDFEKSTNAAAQYLHDLYQREAQASGLLVMACYNWKETRIREMLNKMPENPRDRNFWKLLNRNLVPQETYDYVFYIVAGAVIGENPRLFGFGFDNPIAEAGPEGTIK